MLSWTDILVFGRYPSKGQEAIDLLVNDRLNGILTEQEWSDVVNYLYNTSDSRELNSKLRLLAEGSNDAASESTSISSVGKVKWNQASPGKDSREQKEAEMKKFGYLRSGPKLKKAPKNVTIAFSDFLHCILDFQLKNHEKFLSRFLAAFRQVDTNLDGVIDPEQFHSLFMDIRFDGMKFDHIPPEQQNEAEETFSTLLRIVDPHETNRIMFSAAASCLGRLGGGGKKR